MDDLLVNKVAQSGILTLNPEDYYAEGERILLDIIDQLFQGLILREKDFRAFIAEHDWSRYQNAHVAITCSADAIVPTWAFMLLSNRLTPFANTIVFGDLHTLEVELFRKQLSSLNPEDYKDARVVIKGCGEKGIGPEAYVEITRLLSPVVRSIMYGEPCSTVPVFKRK